MYGFCDTVRFLWNVTQDLISSNLNFSSTLPPSDCHPASASHGSLCVTSTGLPNVHFGDKTRPFSWKTCRLTLENSSQIFKMQIYATPLKMFGMYTQTSSFSGCVALFVTSICHSGSSSFALFAWNKHLDRHAGVWECYILLSFPQDISICSVSYSNCSPRNFNNFPGAVCRLSWTRIRPPSPTFQTIYTTNVKSVNNPNWP